MMDINALINRIDQEIAAEAGRQKCDWAKGGACEPRA